MPYKCAHALCASFCWNIRWVLTPLFGPSFLRDCLPPSHPGYQSFKVDREAIRICRLEISDASRIGTPMSGIDPFQPRNAPRSVPQRKQLPTRKARPSAVVTDSSEDSMSTASSTSNDSMGDDAYSTPLDSPLLSPKSYTPLSWTSINRGTPSPVAPPNSPSFLPSTSTATPGSHRLLPIPPFIPVTPISVGRSSPYPHKSNVRKIAKTVSKRYRRSSTPDMTSASEDDIACNTPSTPYGAAIS